MVEEQTSTSKTRAFETRNPELEPVGTKQTETELTINFYSSHYDVMRPHYVQLTTSDCVKLSNLLTLRLPGVVLDTCDAPGKIDVLMKLLRGVSAIVSLRPPAHGSTSGAATRPPRFAAAVDS